MSRLSWVEHSGDLQVDKKPRSQDFGLVMKRHAAKPAKKKLDYPEETETDRMAAELRQRCNKLTKEQREELSKRAMQVYYGGSWPKEAARS